MAAYPQTWVQSTGLSVETLNIMYGLIHEEIEARYKDRQHILQLSSDLAAAQDSAATHAEATSELDSLREELECQQEQLDESTKDVVHMSKINQSLTQMNQELVDNHRSLIAHCISQGLDIPRHCLPPSEIILADTLVALRQANKTLETALSGNVANRKQDEDVEYEEEDEVERFCDDCASSGEQRRASA